MSRWYRFISRIGALRVISVLGGLYIGIAVALAVFPLMTSAGLAEVIGRFAMVGVPGTVLLYGGYRVPKMDLHPDVYPRIVVWVFGGFGAMAAVVVMIEAIFPGGMDNPWFTVPLATALGSIAGFGMGLYQGRAFSRTREAEQRSDELREERDLRDRIVETSPVGIIVVNADGQISSANRHAGEILGFSQEALSEFAYDEQAFEATAPEGALPAEDIFREVVSTGESIYAVEQQITRADGEQIWLSVNGAPLPDPAGSTAGVIFAFEDITERKQLQEDLRQEHHLRERIFETSPVGVVVLTRDGEISFLNERAEQLAGRTQDELDDLPSESPLFGIVDEAGEPIPAEEMPFNRIVASGEPVFDADFRIARPDGERIWISVNGVPLFGQTEATERVVLTFEDITQRRRYNDRLVTLNELSQNLTDAETEQAVSDLIIETARETLSFPLMAIALYDEEHGQLQYTAQTSAVSDLIDEESLFRSERGLSWQVFSEQSEIVYDDLPAQADVSASETALRSVMIFPVGEHGVFLSGATTTDAFSDTDLSLARMLVANTRSALDRVAREQTVREQRDTLAERTAALERVQRINSTIRGITTELIQASTREEVVQAVCDRLADAEAYRFAWIGTHDTVTDDVTPEAWAGVKEGFLETVTVTADGDADSDDPTGAAVRTRETRVENNLAADPPFESWEQTALDHGFQASIAVPLVYQDTLYGVLTLFADEPDVFNQMEETVLTELGETVGYALNALERKRALVSEQSVELEFELRSGNPPLFRFAAEHDGEFEFENIVQRADESPGIFFTIRGVPSEAVLAFGEESPEIEDLLLVSDREGEPLFETQLHDSAFFSALLDRGAMPQTLTATGDEGYAVIRVPPASNIRSFVEMFEAQYEDVELVGRREVDESIKTQQEFKAEFRSQLTERQDEILKTAYVSGFFESPRATTAQELAETLDVSQPTVSRHIRAGERKLLGILFDEE